MTVGELGRKILRGSGDCCLYMILSVTSKAESGRGLALGARVYMMACALQICFVQMTIGDGCDLGLLGSGRRCGCWPGVCFTGSYAQQSQSHTGFGVHDELQACAPRVEVEIGGCCWNKRERFKWRDMLAREGGSNETAAWNK